eukprot:g40.t1
MSEVKRDGGERSAAAFSLVRGNEPRFATKLHVGRPNVGNFEEFVKFARIMWENRYLTNNGPIVRQFERRLREEMNVAHAICVSNCTIGLEIVLRSFNFPPGSEIVVPSFTFVATAHACVCAGLVVRFADCLTSTHCVDVRSVRRAIGPKTVAILPVNVWGLPCDDDALQELATTHNLKIVYDSAHAFACSASIGGEGQRGSFGDAEVFSFHATKFFNSCEGGVVTTNDDALAEKIRQYRNFAFVDYDTVIGFGTNAKMSEMHAAAGLVNLKCLEKIVKVNRANHATYGKYLGPMKGISLVEYPSKGTWNYQYVVVVIDASAFGLSRDQLVALLHAEGCLARKYFFPGVHRFGPYRQMDPTAERRVPNTIRISESVMTLPTGTAVDSTTIQKICELINDIRLNARALSDHFRRSDEAKALAVPHNPEGGTLRPELKKICGSGDDPKAAKHSELGV